MDFCPALCVIMYQFEDIPASWFVWVGGRIIAFLCFLCFWYQVEHCIVRSLVIFARLQSVFLRLEYVYVCREILIACFVMS